MAIYAYDVTASEVFAERLRGVSAQDATAMGTSITRAASKVNAILIAHKLTPSEITTVTNEQDYTHLREMVMTGAAGYYLETVTGQDNTTVLGEFIEALRSLKSYPGQLASYDPDTGSTNLPSGSPRRDSTTRTAALTRRILDRADTIEWETL